MLVIAGPTASGKTALAIALARALPQTAEIVSCDSVCVYRGMDLGSAKPSAAERAEVPHHLLDVFDPDQPCTAGDYSRLARTAIAEITARGHLPMVVGGTGLYLRALIDGLAPSPPRDEALRARLRIIASSRGAEYLHRILQRIDRAAAALIHANDLPKTVRAIEATLTAQAPLSAQWQQGRDALIGYRIVRIGLDPPRAALYARIDARAAAMFANGLVEETQALAARYGAGCRPLTSLGYKQAVEILNGQSSREAAIAAAQQGHRNYAKRQLTWFRSEPEMHWLPLFGDDSAALAEGLSLVRHKLDHG